MSAAGKIPSGLIWAAATAVALAGHVALARWLFAAQIPGLQDALPAPVYVDLAPPPQPVSEPSATPPAPSSPAQPEPAPPEPAEPEPAEPDPAQAEPAPPEPTLADDPAPVDPAPPDAPSFMPPTLTPLAAPAPEAFDMPAATRALVLAQSDRPAAKPRRSPARTAPPASPTPRSASPRQADASPQNTAPATTTRQPAARAAPSAREIANWQAQVGARIARHMSRTRLTGRRGQVTVHISVRIAANGAATASLGRSTGDAALDRSLAAQAARMPRMPAPPQGQTQSFILPVAVQSR